MQYMNVDMFGVMNERITENIVRQFLKEKGFIIILNPSL